MQYASAGAYPRHQQIRLRRAGKARDDADFRFRIQRSQRRQFRADLGKRRRADAMRSEGSLSAPERAFKPAGDFEGNALIRHFQQRLSGQIQPARGAALQTKLGKVRAQHTARTLIGKRKPDIQQGNTPDRR